MAPAKERPATKTIATNREARHEYFVLEALETGLELKGTEVKSLRAGGVNLKDSWVDIEGGVCWRTRTRSGGCTSSANCRGIRWFLSRSISSMAA